MNDTELEEMLGPPPARDRNGRPVYINDRLAATQNPSIPLLRLVRADKGILFFRWLDDDRTDHLPIRADLFHNTYWIVYDSRSQVSSN